MVISAAVFQTDMRFHSSVQRAWRFTVILSIANGFCKISVSLRMRTSCLHSYAQITPFQSPKLRAFSPKFCIMVKSCCTIRKTFSDWLKFKGELSLCHVKRYCV